MGGEVSRPNQGGWDVGRFPVDKRNTWVGPRYTNPSGNSVTVGGNPGIGGAAGVGVGFEIKLGPKR